MKILFLFNLINVDFQNSPKEKDLTEYILERFKNNNRQIEINEMDYLLLSSLNIMIDVVDDCSSSTRFNGDRIGK